jgi:RNA-binding protein
MQELTGKQKHHLRGIGQGLELRASVGKAGLSEAFVEAVRELLGRQELVKVRLPAGPGKWRDALAGQIARSAGAVCAGVVGRTALLYRPNESLDPKDRIHLP